MARTRTSLLAAVAALALPLAAAPAARADAFDRIFKEYQSTGSINACHFSEADLKEAKGEVPNDIEAYAPDFPNALRGRARAARRRRAATRPRQREASGGARPRPRRPPSPRRRRPPPPARP